MSEAVKKKFTRLFKNGESPSSALDTHKEDLFVQYGDDYYTKVPDRSLCPDLKWCYRLYDSVRTCKYGKRSDDDSNVLKRLDQLLKNETGKDKECVQFQLFENKPVIAILAPFMKRVQKWSYSAVMMFMDSIGNFDQLQYRVFVLLTHSFSGALPLRIIITSNEKAGAVVCSINLLKNLIGTEAFYRNGNRSKVIIKDNSTAGTRRSEVDIFKFSPIVVYFPHTSSCMALPLQRG